MIFSNIAIAAAVMEDIVEARGRIGTKLAKLYDAEGNEIKFDIREDEEQNVKLQETIELLVAAGYFRARIRGLSAFDKWLVKKAIEAKEEIGDFVQSILHSSLIPDTNFQKEISDKYSKGVAAYSRLKSLSNPQRLFKRQEGVVLNEESARVHCSLLEYGWRGVSSVSDLGPGTLNEEQMEKYGDAELSQQLMEEMSEITVSDVKLSAAAVASLMDSKHIQEMASDYARKEDERNVAAGDRRDYHFFGFSESVSALNTEKDYMANRLAELKYELSTCETESERLREQYEHLKAVCSDFVEEHKKQEELEASVDKETVEKLKELMIQHDEVRQREQEYKDKCKKEMAEIQMHIRKLKGRGTTDAPETEARKKEIREEFEIERRRFTEARLCLADLNKQIAALQRKIDEVPSRTELNQYQRRFLELYNQVASKHRETKQFYTLFNTLQDVKTYMAKEISLLDSVCSQYSVAMSGESFKQEFLKQLEHILEGVKQNQIRVEKRHTEEKMKRDHLRETYQEMLDKQRLYYKTVKDFQEVCRRNEILSAKIKELETGERSEDDS